MDESGKGPDLVENAERQSRPRLDASEATADDFARAAAGQAITSSSADTAQDEPGQFAAEPAGDAIPPRPLRLAMMAASLATAAALGHSSDLSPPAVLANSGRAWLQAPQVPLLINPRYTSQW